MIPRTEGGTTKTHHIVLQTGSVGQTMSQLQDVPMT